MLHHVAWLHGWFVHRWRYIVVRAWSTHLGLEGVKARRQDSFPRREGGPPLILSACHLKVPRIYRESRLPLAGAWSPSLCFGGSPSSTARSSSATLSSPCSSVLWGLPSTRRLSALTASNVGIIGMPRGDCPRGRARDAGYPPSSDDERPLGRDDVARAVAFDIAVARGAAEAELAVASAEAQAAEARLLAAQRRYSIFTATDPPAADPGAGSAQTPTAASEACARGALLARTAQAAAASLDSAMWLGPDAPTVMSTPGLDAWDTSRTFGQFTQDFSRVFDPRRPERGYEPPPQPPPTEGGQLPGLRTMYRCTACHQPRGEHFVCSWCDGSFCDDCVWEVETEGRPQRRSCARCSEGNGAAHRGRASDDGAGAAEPR